MTRNRSGSTPWPWSALGRRLRKALRAHGVNVRRRHDRDSQADDMIATENSREVNASSSTADSCLRRRDSAPATRQQASATCPQAHSASLAGLGAHPHDMGHTCSIRCPCLNSHCSSGLPAMPAGRPTTPKPSATPPPVLSHLLRRATGPKTPSSVIERERYLQPADRRNLDLAPYYNPLGTATTTRLSRSLPLASGSMVRRRLRTPGAAATSNAAAWFDELVDREDDVDGAPQLPRYGDRRQSRRMRPDEIQDLEDQLQVALAVDRLGRPPEYQRVTVYV